MGEVGSKGGAAPLDAHAPRARKDPAEARAFVTASALAGALDVPLVLHGPSGVPDEQLTAAVSGGMAKVNTGTALNVA